MRSLSRHRPTAGFSLVETVIVMFLAGIMLSCVASLTDKTLKTLRFLQEKSTTTESATLACQRLASELYETVTVPTTGSSVSFRKVLPSADVLLDNDPLAPVWSRVYPLSETATIVYSLDDQKVFRTVNSEQPLEMAVNVNAFSVQQFTAGQDGAYRVALTILEARRAVSFETIVICPGVPD